MRKLSKLIFIPLLLLGLLAQAQNRTIKGKVVSAQNNTPLSGASVLIKGTSTGVATGADGSFSLSVPSGAVTLVISSVGYGTMEQTVGASESDITVTLTEGVGSLNEVVVTALGITRQTKTLVYGTQSVKTSELTEVRDADRKSVV